MEVYNGDMDGLSRYLKDLKEKYGNARIFNRPMGGEEILKQPPKGWPTYGEIDLIQHGLEERDYWEQVLQDRLDKGKEYYERNYLGLPQYIIDAFKEE